MRASGFTGAPRPRFAALLALLVFGARGSLEGQSPDIRLAPYSGAGYSASLPGVLTGLGAFHIMPERGFGLFVNGHFTLDSPGGDAFFFDDRTPDQAAEEGHRFLREEPAYLSFGVGLLRAFDPEVAFYAGVGVTRERIYEEWEHPEQPDDFGDFGHYWVENDDLERTGVNVTAGLFIQGGRHLFFRVGGELFPLGGSLGVYWAFPR